MKKTGKILALVLTVAMLLTVCTVNVGAVTNNWSEYRYDFNDTSLFGTVVDSSDQTEHQIPGTHYYMASSGGWEGWTTTFMQKPGSEDSGDGVIKMYRPYDTNTPRTFAYYSYLTGNKAVFSFKINIENGNFIIDRSKPDFNVFSVIGGTPSSAGNTCVYPAGHSMAGQNVVLANNTWYNVSVILDDTQSGRFTTRVFIDGIEVLPETTVFENNLSGEAWDSYLEFRGGSGTDYLDDIECRLLSSTLATAPTADIDNAHKGESVDITNRNIALTFDGGSEYLMDTTTYSNAISVYKGAQKLTSGIDYTLSCNDTNSLGITFANDLMYSTNYKISVANTAKNLAGVAASASELTFKTMARPGGQENDTPVVSILSPANNTRFDPCENFDVNVSAADSDGIADVKLYVDGELQGTAIVAPYTFTINLTQGNHTLTATATDAYAEPATGQSSAVAVDVYENTPTDVIFNVSDGMVFRTTAGVSLRAYAKDEDGEALSDVSIYMDGEKVGTNVYSTVPSVGIHNFEARVTDSRGNVYTKSAVIEYRPEYIKGDGSIEKYDFDTTSFPADAFDGITTGTAAVGEGFGNSFYFEASEAAIGIDKFKEWGWNYWRNGTMEYDFMCEDVSAFNIRVPGTAGDNDGITSKYKILGGVITDTESGMTYGTIEPNVWYHVEIIFDTDAHEAYISLAGRQFTEAMSNGGGFVRALRFYAPIVKSGAAEGAKCYIDNVKDTIYGGAYIKPYSVAAVTAGVNQVDTDYITADVNSFIVTFVRTIPSGTDLTSLITLSKNGTPVGCTATVYGEEGNNNNYKFYKYAKVTPTDALEVGAEYTINFAANFPGQPENDTCWSTSRNWSLCSYAISKTCTSENFIVKDAGIYDGANKISAFSDITGNTVKLSLTAENLNSAQKDAYVIIASYNGERIIDVKVKKAEIAAGIEDTAATDGISVMGADKVRGFIWEGTNTMVPYASSVVAE